MRDATKNITKILLTLFFFVGMTFSQVIAEEGGTLTRNSPNVNYIEYEFNCDGTIFSLTLPNKVLTTYDSFEFYVSVSDDYESEIGASIAFYEGNSQSASILKDFSSSNLGTFSVSLKDIKSTMYRVGVAYKLGCTIENSNDSFAFVDFVDSIESTSDCPAGEFINISNARVDGSQIVVDVKGCVDGSSRFEINDMTSTPRSVLDGLGQGSFSQKVGVRPYDGRISLIMEGKINGKVVQKYGADINPEVILVESDAEDSFKWCVDMKGEELQRCSECIGSRSNPTGAIWTELGCIDPSPAGIITRIFQIGIGIMGGVIIIRLIQISLLYLKEDAQSLEEARDMITSLIMGLILLVGGVIILQFVGVNILGLPEGYLGG